jgi:hypothetical protein
MSEKPEGPSTVLWVVFGLSLLSVAFAVMALVTR